MKIVIIYMTLVQNFETNWYQFDFTVIYLEYQKKKKEKKSSLYLSDNQV